MHHHVTPQFQRALQHGRGEGVVSNGARTGLVGHVGQGGNVDTLQQRVGRCFNPDNPGVGLQGSGDNIQLRHVNKAGADLPLGKQVLQDIGGAMVNVQRRQHMVTGLQALKNCRHSGQSRAKSRTHLAPFQRRQRRLQAVSVGVAVAGVQITARVGAVGLTLKGGGEVNGVHHRARGGVHAMTGVHGECFKAVSFVFFHGRGGERSRGMKESKGAAQLTGSTFNYFALMRCPNTALRQITSLPGQ